MNLKDKVTIVAFIAGESATCLAATTIFTGGGDKHSSPGI